MNTIPDYDGARGDRMDREELQQTIAREWTVEEMGELRDWIDAQIEAIDSEEQRKG